MKYYLARKTSEIYKKMDRFGKYNIKPSNQNTKRQKLHILLCVWIPAYNIELLI